MMLLVSGGCNKYDFDDGGYTDAYDGLTMYYDAWTTRVFATDGVTIAMKLAIILDEIEDAGLSFDQGDEEPDWDQLPTYTINSRTYDIRTMVLGYKSLVTLEHVVGDPDSGVYKITFYSSSTDDEDTGATTDAVFDNVQRVGGSVGATFTIDTKGLRLDESTAGNPWEITFGEADEEAMRYTAGDYYVSATYNRTLIYSLGNGEFNLTCTFQGYYYGTSPSTTGGYKYVLTGSLGISDFTDFMVKNTFDRNFTMDLATDNTDSNRTTLKGNVVHYETSTPLVFSPSTNGFFSIEGVEYIYDLDMDYTAQEATVTSKSDGSRTIKYNGYSYTWNW